jgi:hypothetical protein
VLQPGHGRGPRPEAARSVVTFPRDRCQRCIALLGEEVYSAERDRVCPVCAERARRRNEPVERICPVCHGEPLVPGVGPDGKLWPRACGACTPLPANVLELIEDDEQA